MKNLHYLGYVHGPEFGADDHYVYWVTITRALIQRVAGLARAVTELGVFCIEEFDSSVQVFKCWPTDTPEALVHPDSYDPQIDPDEAFDAQESLVYPEALKLTVYRDGDFCWSWHPKHCGQHEQCETDVFSLETVRRDWRNKAQNATPVYA